MITMFRLLRGINLTVVLCSAVLTAYFGYTLANGSLLGWATLVPFFFACSLLCPMLWEFLAKQMHDGRKAVVAFALPFAAFFFIYDIVTNFGAGALIREAELVIADNQNTNAANARGEVGRINKRIAAIRGQTAWQTDYLAPAAYDSQILRWKSETERGRNIWQRSKQCTDTTLATSQRVCQGIAEALANKQNALHRQGLKSEMVELERELRSAKATVLDTPTKASAALTHARNLGAGLTGSMEPDKVTKFWANYGLTASAAFACSLASIVTGMMLGWLQGGRHSADWGPDPYQAQYRNEWIADQRSAAQRAEDAARMAGAGGAIPGGNISVTSYNSSTDDALEHLARVIEKVNKAHTVH